MSEDERANALLHASRFLTEVLRKIDECSVARPSREPCLDKERAAWLAEESWGRSNSGNPCLKLGDWVIRVFPRQGRWRFGIFNDSNGTRDWSPESYDSVHEAKVAASVRFDELHADRQHQSSSVEDDFIPF